MSAFDRICHPALLSTPNKLDFSLALLKWIAKWLEGRTMAIHVGDAISRTINIHVGTPKGSVLAPTLFRLQVHFLPVSFRNLTCHLFVDDLVIIIPGALENKFSSNIMLLEKQAETAMRILERYSSDYILPVNSAKTKALLVHNVVAPPYPNVRYKETDIEIVSSFKYLVVHITTKIGRGTYIEKRMKKVRKIYHALRILFRSIPTKTDQNTKENILCTHDATHQLALLVLVLFHRKPAKNDRACILHRTENHAQSTTMGASIGLHNRKRVHAQ